MKPVITQIIGAGKLLLVLSLLFSNQISSQQAWTRVPVPDTSITRNILNSIAGISSSDVWAVGNYETDIPGNLKNQVLHWNGAEWQKFDGTDLSSTYNSLWDITAITSSDVWAVGSYVEPGTTRSQLMHWNGSNWTHTILPAIPGGSFLNSIDAIASNDIWAVGGKSGSPTRPAYVLHYNGSGWTEFSAASPGSYRNYFNAVDAKTSSDVWAVGFYSNAYGDFHAMAQHWDGSNWSNTPLPSSVTAPIGELLSVTVISSNDVWALGSTATGEMLMIHWDGSVWTEMPTSGAAGGVIISRGTDVFAVGDRISQWNGTSWTVIDPLSNLQYPTLISAVQFSNGDIWTSGRVVIDDKFFNLVYRTANAIPGFTHGSTQFVNVPLNGQNIDQQLTVEDADISQVVTYKIISSPSLGIITGLPDTAITNNGFASTTGASYQRNPGYTGPDQFVVEAAVGNLKSQTTITVNPFGALPVVLDNYSVIKSGNTALMKWKTATEENTREFIMERSSDGILFSTVGTVPAAGSAHSYSLADLSPKQGLNFYRLRLLDLDDRETIFATRTLSFDFIKAFTIDQNPFTGRILSFRIHIPGNYMLNIFDSQGRMILSNQVDRSREHLLVELPAGIAPGLYLATLGNNEHRWTERIVLK